MKKLLYIIIFFGFVFNTYSQVVFCPKGAEWTYLFETWPAQMYPSKIIYKNDSVIGQDTVKVLVHTKIYKNQNHCSYYKYTLLKQKGDTIFFRNDRTDGLWQILYNFATPPGQFWQTLIDDENGNPQQYFIMVDSSYSVMKNNMLLKRLSVRYIGGRKNYVGAWYAKDRVHITERFGCSDFMFNYTNIDCVSDADHFMEFLCYRDSVYGLEQFGAKPCDFYNTIGISERHTEQKKIVIIPDYRKESLKIIVPENMQMPSFVQISDISGRILVTENCSEHSDLSMTKLKGGLYFARWIKNEEIIAQTKFVIIK